MSLKNIFIISFLLMGLSSYSQKKKEVVFRDTLVFYFKPDDFLPFKYSKDKKIFYRIEEKDRENLSYFFQIIPIKELKSNHDVLDLNKFLYSDNYFKDDSKSFKYENIQKKMTTTDIIFLETTCFEEKYYFVQLIKILQ